MSEPLPEKRPVPLLGIVMILIGVAVLATIPFHPVRGMTNPNDPGPWLLPRLLAVSLMIGGGLLFRKRHRLPARRATTPKPTDFSRMFLIAGVAAYLFAMQWIGFLVATPVFAFLMLVRSGTRWPIAIGTAAVITLLAYGLFVGLFKVPLPGWYWS